MKTRKKFSPVLFLFLLPLTGCDLFGGDDSSSSPSIEERAFQATSNARATQTAVPRATWTAQALGTLTALPANETATGSAMGATETSAAVATAQLFTREAQTVTANLTATAVALARGTNTPSPTATFTPSPVPTLPPTADVAQIPPQAANDPLGYLKAAEDAKWRVAWVSKTQGKDWAGEVVSQTAHYDGANYYGDSGTAEAWVFSDAYFLRQNGELRKAGAEVAARALAQLKDGWQTGIRSDTLKCAPGVWNNQFAVACAYERTSTFRNEDILNKLTTYIDSTTNLPLAVTNVFNPITNPNTTGSGTTAYSYTTPPPISPPQ